jgi:voltage-gated potassium channel
MSNTVTNLTVCERFGPWQLFIATLSLLAFVSLAYEQFAKPPADTLAILYVADFVVCAFFLADFCWQLGRAENKWVYMRFGWIDLLSSIPMLPFLMWARVFRFARLLRVATSLKSWRHFVYNIFGNPAYGTALVTITAVIFVVFGGAIVILELETSPDSNIRNASDALWWSISTVTTVGYGDRFPVTDAGRFFAALLMLVGIGVYGTITGLFATWFISGIRKN